MKDVTQRQREVLAAIERITETQGYAPSIRQLADAIGIRSTNGVADHVKALRKKGLVVWDERRSRSLRAVRSDEAPAQPTLPALRSPHIIDVRLVRTRGDRWNVVLDGQRTPVQGARSWREALMLLAAIPDTDQVTVTVAGDVATVHQVSKGSVDRVRVSELTPIVEDNLGARLGTILGDLRADLAKPTPVDPSPNPLPFEP